MFPPVWPILTASGVWVSELQAVFGAPDPRIYPFGSAPQDIPSPYALWQTINGNPENYLGDAPDLDGWLVQFDVYADNVADVYSCAKALRNALEPKAYIENWRGESTDPDTKEYRYSFDVRILTPR